MTWVVWRQHRTLLLYALSGMAASIAALVVLGVSARASVTSLGMESCIREATGCPPAAVTELSDRLGTVVSLLPLPLLVLPIVLGALAGAPLFARDHEQRIHLFTLTQSVSRARWWATKLLVVGGPLLAAVLLLGFAAAWAQQPLVLIQSSRFEMPNYQTRGLVLAGYFLAALAVAATAGLLLRNTVGAIAVTIAAYLLLVPGLGLVRSDLLASTSVDVPLTAEADAEQSGAVFDSTYVNTGVPANAWVVSSGVRDSSGRAMSIRYSDCSAGSDPTTCAIEQGAVTDRSTYHPPDQFWTLQGIEAGITTALSGIVLLVGLLHARRRTI